MSTQRKRGAVSLLKWHFAMWKTPPIQQHDPLLGREVHRGLTVSLLFSLLMLDVKYTQALEIVCMWVWVCTRVCVWFCVCVHVQSIPIIRRVHIWEFTYLNLFGITNSVLLGLSWSFPDTHRVAYMLLSSWQPTRQRSAFLLWSHTISKRPFHDLFSAPGFTVLSFLPVVSLFKLARSLGPHCCLGFPRTRWLWGTLPRKCAC